MSSDRIGTLALVFSLAAGLAGIACEGARTAGPAVEGRTPSAGPLAPALEAGDEVVLLVPTGPFLSERDVALYTGRPAEPSPANGCTSIADDATLYPAQEWLVRDGDSALIGRGRPQRISGIVTISQTEPVPTGTRLADLTFLGACTTSGNVTYDKYRGVVE